MDADFFAGLAVDAPELKVLGEGWFRARSSSVGTKKTVVVVGVFSSINVLVEVEVLVSVKMFVDSSAFVMVLMILTTAVLVRVAFEMPQVIGMLLKGGILA